MTGQEQYEKIYQLYATLGELSVLKKETTKKLKLIDIDIEKFERQLKYVKTLKTTELKEVINREQLCQD